MSAPVPTSEAWKSVDSLADWFQQAHEVTDRKRALQLAAMLFAANNLHDQGMVEIDPSLLFAEKDRVLTEAGYPKMIDNE